jgi:hypothetical protein
MTCIIVIAAIVNIFKIPTTLIYFTMFIRLFVFVMLVS